MNACKVFASLLAAGLVLTGCAGLGGLGTPQSRGAGTAHAPAGEPLTPEAARERVAPGRSSKAEVAAALGPAIVIPFDSGYEVWVYRWPGADRKPREATELVLLFDPAGRLAKSRVRRPPGFAAGG
jgi:hypothetical protein